MTPRHKQPPWPLPADQAESVYMAIVILGTIVSAVCCVVHSL